MVFLNRNVRYLVDGFLDCSPALHEDGGREERSEDVTDHGLLLSAPDDHHQYIELGIRVVEGGRIEFEG